MRYTVLFSILLLLTFTSCRKNKYTTIPQLRFKSVNTTNLHRGETLRMILSFTDAEGDLTDSLFVQKIVKACPGGINGSFKQPYKIPDFPTTKNQQGDIAVIYSYNDLNPKCSLRNDTAIFKFVLRDKALNKSDTLVSPPIVIIY